MDTLVYDIGNSRYVNLSDRCSLRCQFCPKTHHKLQLNEYDLTLEKRPTTQAIIGELGDPTQFDEVVFCGFGESTLRLKELISVATFVKNNGGSVRLNTDGLGSLVNKRNILPELSTCVDALCVSMNAQDEDIYNRHCQPTLKGSYVAMLEFLADAPNYIQQVTATAIDGLEGVNIKTCEALAAERGVSFRRRELDVVG
ncbi:MAG: TatD family nuclease-associated radical SAM protein [Cycloclasticus sp.]|nr:TatD family nuclease-associated radical SAM protein [Cycloclasticus sp.]